MKITRLTCLRCGSPVEVLENTRQVACTNCSTLFKVEPEDGEPEPEPAPAGGIKIAGFEPEKLAIGATVFAALGIGCLVLALVARVVRGPFLLLLILLAFGVIIALGIRYYCKATMIRQMKQHPASPRAERKTREAVRLEETSSF